jgi:ribose/xylose/arabinose/galactoside ABC-type transport system permease subunit
MCRCVSSELLLDSRPPLFLRPVLCSSCCYVGIINPFFFSHVFCNSFCFSLLVCCVSYCLLVLWRFDLSIETFVTVIDYVNAYSVSASFWKLLLVPSGYSNMFVLICVSFASVTTLCGSLRGPCLFWTHFLHFVYIFTLSYFVLGLLFGSPPIFRL